MTSALHDPPSKQPATPAVLEGEPVPKVLGNLVTTVHRMRDELGMSADEIKAALKAHRAKRDQATGS